MVRFVFNLSMTGLAIALLGVLVLLSTNVDEDVRRHFDQSVRQLRDLGLAIERETLNARNLNVDHDARLSSLQSQMRASVDAVGKDLGVLYPTEPSASQRFRAASERAFNSIDDSPYQHTSVDEIWNKFVTLDQSTRWFADRTDTFRRNHQSFLQNRDRLAEESRAYVQQLRERGQASQADSTFRAAQQVLERAQRGGESDLAQIDGIADRIAGGPQSRTAVDREVFLGLIESMRALVPTRTEMESSIADITSGRFQRQVADLRELVTRDHLYRLGTVNDSRVLLNVYTALLLLVLGYFGFRLQLSYRDLNRSHEDLERANESLEQRVQERTVDLEQALADLKESQVQLVQAEKMSSLGQLVAGVVHEINTPLLYVLNNTTVTAENVEELRGVLERAAAVVRLVKEGNTSPVVIRAALDELAATLDPDAAVETIEEIQDLSSDSTDGLNQISELVQSLKDFSRIDRAAEDRFDVREGLEKTLLITKNLLKYGVEVEKHLDQVPLILCAPSRINQVFINLITNAVQAMDGKGKLTVRTRKRDDFVEIGVRDTGCGIPSENLDKIMDPFFTTKPVGQGTGLGLSIVRKIVDEHGGQIEIDSVVGRGTEMRILLPIERRSHAEAA